MLHSAFGAQYGFLGSPDELADVLLATVGPAGHVLMVSLPYRSSSLAYLQRGRQFDVRKTPSMMGLVSEFFRRRPGVVRSLHPTHPILVFGPKADWFVADHPNCVHPCGPNTPFDRVLQANGKALFFNVPLDTFTFFHYLEHIVAPFLPFPVYTDELFEVPVIDADGNKRTVRTHVYAENTIRRRRFPILEEALRSRGHVRSARVGASELLAVDVRDAVETVLAMHRAGRYFYDMSDLAPPPPRAAEAMPQL